MARRFLGSAGTWTHRVRVYLADDAVEVDEIEGYEGTRSRVLFDEVLLLTLDRRRRAVTLVVCFGVGLSLYLPVAIKPEGILLAIMSVYAAPFLIVGLLHVAFGTDCITVFGRRSTAQMRFSFRKARARRVFAELQERIALAQQGASP